MHRSARSAVADHRPPTRTSGEGRAPSLERALHAEMVQTGVDPLGRRA